MNRKYPKTNNYYVYAHILPNKDVYFGCSNQETCDRWQPKYYKSTVLYKYINQYGWENIEHRVLIDNLTEKQALLIEDWYIRKGWADGFCINKQRSGCRSRSEQLYDYNHSEKGINTRKKYSQSEKGIETKQKWLEEHKEEIADYQKQYRQQHLKEKRQYDKEYQETHKEEIKEKNKIYYEKNKERIKERSRLNRLAKKQNKL